jgi:hypothetical protein
MNEQIRLLAEQAGIATNLETNYSEKEILEWMDYYSQKFAELIIQECATLTLDHRSDDYYQGWLDYRDEIRRHFGVES